MEPKHRTPFHPANFAPEVLNLIALPRDEATDRLRELISNVNLVCALLLAGVLSAGLEPLEVKSLEEQYHTAGEWAVGNAASHCIDGSQCIDGSH